MSEVAPLISDLATILIIAGIITVIFKWLGQPVIVGYIVAGIMAGPSISLFPTVSDQANIKIWADIGVIFLLFAIGLDFSFRKLISVGASAIFSTVIIVCGWMFPGIYGGNAMASHTRAVSFWAECCPCPPPPSYSKHSVTWGFSIRNLPVLSWGY